MPAIETALQWPNAGPAATLLKMVRGGIIVFSFYFSESMGGEYGFEIEAQGVISVGGRCSMTSHCTDRTDLS